MSQDIAKILELYDQENLSNDYFLIFINYILLVICSFILKILYENKSSSLSGKFHVGIVIPILSQITFLIILIVKSSLALSLGLIGALSIVRFRTPIKEPEELIYLFFSIAIGIGFGAGQTLLTSLVFILIIITIYFFVSKKTSIDIIDYNLLIEVPYSQEQKPKQNEIIEIIKKNFENYNINKIEIDDGIKLLIVLEISSKEIEQISKLESNIKSKYNNSKISYFENKVLT
tara:strand:- start:4571 stop:5266 length:696 start_codon:yes stop_codon:yes gene_type:complete